MKYICYYINRNGKNDIKTFDTLDEAFTFVAILDKLIERGVCGGYSLTKL